MRASIRIQALEVQTWDFNVSSLIFFLLLWKCLIFESFPSDVLLKMNKYKERQQTLSVCAAPRMFRSRGRSRSTLSPAAAQPSPSSTCRGSCTWPTPATAGAEIGNENGLPVCFVPQGSQFVFPCVCRAIIIRNNDIIPMSTEFTPESERQRLQFLVKKKKKKMNTKKEKGRHRPELRKPTDKRKVLQGPYRMGRGLSFSAVQSGNWIKQSAKDTKLWL